MNTLVVLFALFAAAVAKPGALAPFGYGSYIAPLSYAAPAPLLATRYSTPYLHAPLLHTSPLAYSAPAHFIKKRSVAFPLATSYSSYIAPTTYAASPLLTTYAAPAIHSAPIYHAPLAYSGHFIKKRSAPLAISTYIAPTTYAANPLLTTYAAPAIHSAPIYHAPLAYSGHFIKKRSAPLAISAYAAPFSVSHQSRFDVHHSAPVVSAYAAPLAYTSPLAYSHYF